MFRSSSSVPPPTSKTWSVCVTTDNKAPKNQDYYRCCSDNCGVRYRALDRRHLATRGTTAENSPKGPPGRARRNRTGTRRPDVLLSPLPASSVPSAESLTLRSRCRRACWPERSSHRAHVGAKDQPRETPEPSEQSIQPARLSSRSAASASSRVARAKLMHPSARATDLSWRRTARSALEGVTPMRYEFTGLEPSRWRQP